MPLSKNEIIQKLKELKLRYMEEGFIIVGLFGSYARDENQNSSDIDIIYDVDDIYLQKYSGFEAISRVREISQELAKEFKTRVDIVSLPKYGNKRVQESIKKDLIYV